MAKDSKLTINDLPEDVVEEMKKAIRAEAQMQVLQQKKLQALKAYNYVEVAQLAKLIKEVEIRVINEYLSNYEGEAVRMDSLMVDMSEEDREKMNIYTNAIIFLSDMIETLSIESDQILKKYHPDYNLEMFNRLIQLGKEAKNHVKFMSENTDMVYQVSFASGADDITELMMNKVKAFIRKLRNKNEVLTQKS